MAETFNQALDRIDRENAERAKRELLKIELAAARNVENEQNAATGQSNGANWSRADSPGEWAKLFGVTVRTFTRWINADPPKIRAKIIDSKNIMVDLRDMPTRNR